MDQANNGIMLEGIATVGFPIVACLGVAWMFWKVIERLLAQVDRFNCTIDAFGKTLDKFDTRLERIEKGMKNDE